MSKETKPFHFDVNTITDMIPHRYPILLVDRILELERGESATALKNVTMNEPHFMGHFPGFLKRALSMVMK